MHFPAIIKRLKLWQIIFQRAMSLVHFLLMFFHFARRQQLVAHQPIHSQRAVPRTIPQRLVARQVIQQRLAVHRVIPRRVPVEPEIRRLLRVILILGYCQ